MQEVIDRKPKRVGEQQHRGRNLLPAASGQPALSVTEQGVNSTPGSTAVQMLSAVGPSISCLLANDRLACAADNNTADAVFAQGLADRGQGIGVMQGGEDDGEVALGTVKTGLEFAEQFVGRRVGVFALLRDLRNTESSRPAPHNQ